MTAKISDGNYTFDSCGNLLEADTNEELLQRAYFRLTAHYGEFELDRQLGSELYKMDLANTSDDIIFSHIVEVLMPISEIDVTAVEKVISSNDNGGNLILLTVYLRLNNSENAIIELRV